ncbi:hypothetical protein D3C78_1008040 [compost metagenome]
MQDIQQEIGGDDQRSELRVEEIKTTGKRRQQNIGPEEHFQFAEAIGQGLGQCAANHHANDAQRDKQTGKGG